MKTIILLLSFFFLGCNQNENHIDNIEIIDYRRNFDSNFDSKILTTKYTNILGDGKAESYGFLINEGRSKFFKYYVNKELLDEIAIKTLHSDEKYFLNKQEDFADEIFCGIDSYTRFRIIFDNKKSITFVYSHRKLKTEKYSDFKKLNQEFESKNTLKTEIVNNDTLKLLDLKKSFEQFASDFKEEIIFPNKIEKPKFNNK
ncbi:MAG: hypothetical protein O9267_05325 [Flavobacterium sp.]|uniref:hypothetical protein n=1 Tax=Flavobacterium sp. TaxID=239 RepID=UPI0022C8E291|nr:hypothetical protein [Flavobacterium sp.]MCZ8197005.1 hypothetical protein [Flavobacterium sp.]